MSGSIEPLVVGIEGGDGDVDDLHFPDGAAGGAARALLRLDLVEMSNDGFFHDGLLSAQERKRSKHPKRHGLASSSPCRDGDEVAEFIGDVRGFVHRGGDFGADQFAETGA